jgi:uncharacterized protein
MRLKLKNKHISFLLIFAVFFLSSIPSFAQVTIPERPLNYVVDLAGIINEDVEASLNRYLLELEQKTTAQMVILTINSLEGESIEDLSIRIAHEKWRLGQKGKDNGVLLLVSVGDRKYRFEIGYGLEGILPDSLVGSIGRSYLVPYFRKGDYSTGIFKATLAIIGEIASNQDVEITGTPKLRTYTASPHGMKTRRPSVLSALFTILFFMALAYLFIRHPRLLLLLLMFSMIGGGRRGWAGGGGFGGGFGSFGGGGGGGFGGGGASGGW